MSPSSLSNTGRPEDEYRARVLEALREALDRPNGMAYFDRVSTAVLAVRDEEIEKLRGKVERLRSDLAHTEETAIKVIAKRTEKAEAEVEKLRADLAHTEKIANDVIGERDMAHDILDRFAALVAPVEVIGEHTSGNNPWRNAMDMVTPAAVVEKLRADLDRVRRFSEMVINSSIRVQAIQQARDTLTILDGKEVQDPAVEAERDDVEKRLQRLADQMIAEREEFTARLLRQRDEAEAENARIRDALHELVAEWTHRATNMAADSGAAPDIESNRMLAGADELDRVRFALGALLNSGPAKDGA